MQLTTAAGAPPTGRDGRETMRGQPGYDPTAPCLQGLDAMAGALQSVQSQVAGDRVAWRCRWSHCALRAWRTGSIVLTTTNALPARAQGSVGGSLDYADGRGRRQRVIQPLSVADCQAHAAMRGGPSKLDRF